MADRHGPIRGGRFKVTIDDVEVPGWHSVSVPASSTKRAAESDEDAWGQTTYQDLEMERGVQPGDTRIHDWREEIVDGNEQDGLKTVVVTLMDEEGADQIEWTFEDAWITYHEPPQLDASSDGVVTERISLAYESMERTFTA